MIGSHHKGWIGIDLGMHTVKLVQTERHGGRIQLAEALLVRRPEPWADNGNDVPPPAESVEEIRAGLALGSGFSGRNAAIALPMSLCDVRSCSISEGSDQEVRSMISQELSSLLGELGTNREFDFWTSAIAGDQQAQSDNALVASVSCDWANQVARDLTEAGLVGQVLDSLPMALARAVELGAPNSSRVPVAAVDWGYRRATLCAVLHGRPLFVRCLRDAGFSAMVSALMKALSLTNEEAQKLLTTHVLTSHTTDASDDLQGVIEDVTTEPLDVFVGEIQRTIGFLRQQRRALAPTKIVLFGGGAAMNNVATHLSRRLNLPTETWTLDGRASAGRARIPVELLGPAVALSSLAWSKA